MEIGISKAILVFPDRQIESVAIAAHFAGAVYNWHVKMRDSAQKMFQNFGRLTFIFSVTLRRYVAFRIHNPVRITRCIMTVSADFKV